MNDKDMKNITGIPHTLSEDGRFYEIDKESDEYKLYKTASDKQLDEWLYGNPTVTTWHSNPDYQEDTPDFSSSGSPIWPYELRLRYYHGTQEVREQMCLKGLNSLISEYNLEDKVHVSN